MFNCDAHKKCLKLFKYFSIDRQVNAIKLFLGPATVELQVDKFRNEQKGFAFINYVMPENALAAYDNLDGTIFQVRIFDCFALIYLIEFNNDFNNYKI